MIRQIRDKTFKIEYVTMECSMLYGDMIDMSVEIGLLQTEYEEEVNGKDKKKSIELFREFKAKLKSHKEEIIRIRWELLKCLLDANGYDFDLKWWEKSVSVDDINDLVIDSIRKDRTEKDDKRAKK